MVRAIVCVTSACWKPHRPNPVIWSPRAGATQPNKLSNFSFFVVRAGYMKGNVMFVWNDIPVIRHSGLSVVHLVDRTVLQKSTSPQLIRKNYLKKKLNSIVWVRERTIPTERPPLVAEIIANFFVDRGCHMVSVTDTYCRILGFLDRSRYFSIK
jgi:hypothetical protein